MANSQVIDVVLNIISKYTTGTAFSQLSKEQRDLDVNLQKNVASLNAVRIAQEKYLQRESALTDQLNRQKISQGQYNQKIIEAEQALLTRAIPSLQAYNRVLNDNERILNKQRVPGQLSAAAITPEERAGARRFAGTVPTLRRELAGIDAYNKSLSKQADAATKAQKANQQLVSTLAQAATVYYFLRSIGTIVADTIERILDFVTAANALSQILGITTAQASGFVFQADELGVSVDTVTEAYRTFGDRLGRATGLFGEQNRASRQMQDAMKDLGISLFKPNGELRSMGEIIPDVADAVQKLGPGIKTTAIATALFGQRSDELLPLLLQGSEGMERAAEKATRLGFALNNIETQQLREASIALQDIGKSGEAVGLTLTKGLAPILPAIADAAINAAAFVDRAFVNISASIISTMAQAIGIIEHLRTLVTGGTPTLTQEDIDAVAMREATAFAASRGYVLGDNGTFVRGPAGDQSGGIGSALIPGEDSDSAESQAVKAAKKLRELSELLMKRQHIIRDAQMEMARDAAEHGREMLNEEIDYQIESDRKFEDFLAKKLDAQEDFDREQADRVRDFGREQLQRQQDFDSEAADDYQDYIIDRDRMIEDAMNKEMDRAEKNTEARIRLEEKQQKEIAALRAKWDEIMLRLQVGGDRESIELARQKAAEALALAQQENQTELDRLTGGQGQDGSEAEDDLQLRLRRLQEDAQIEADRKSRDFENDRSQREEEFNIEQGDRKREFEIDKAREQQEFLIKDARSREEFFIKRQRDMEEYAIQQSEKAQRNFSELIEINSQIAAKRGLYTQDLNTFREYQFSLTDIAEMEAERRRRIIEDSLPMQTGVRGRAFGGMVPGSLGSPQMILAHGGERIVPPATSSYFNSVRSGDQISINSPVTISNSIGRGDPALISATLSRELSRTRRIRRSFGR